ncbi:unnamed protein product [Miscanthus lutarioriparius]|uniref:Uncharacterized protein n=1 Tax=Miscanthus lutarioriparius TaxID=422564 RepID=A0A811Q8D6_9POAL|nr:unnamed protein product [Miscanthus lutarioriparius]
MESTAAWAGPYELQLAKNWTAQHHDPDPTETYMNSPEKLFQERQKEFMDDAKLMKTKMHRYPPSIQALGDWCTMPKVVAIGPYYHPEGHLQKAEKMKHVAAQYCIQEYKKVNNDNSGLSVRDMYDAVVSVAAKIDARALNDKDVMAANKTTKLPDMGLARKWIIFAELSMAPLSLNDARASWLVNMAALEICTTPNFLNAKAEDSAVCSYLLLLCMLMHREKDVHELRTKGILQGGAGLKNKTTLDFFTSLQSLRKGRCYADVIVEIHIYRNKRPWIKVYAFLYNNCKYIVAVVSAFGGFIGIITALMRLKGAH